MLESPHFGVQIEGIPSHPYPSSIRQWEEHPSSGRLFLSSHSSERFKEPSPQVLMHILGAERQNQPDSISHDVEHPSPESVLLSSHSS